MTYEQVRKRISELVPDVMKLEFGCEIIYGSDKFEAPKVTIGNPYEVRGDKVVNPWCLDDSSYLIEILGRDPSLADVLKAINKMDIKDEFGQKEILSITDFGMFEGNLYNWEEEPVFWNLPKPLSGQSQETLDFIGELIN